MVRPYFLFLVLLSVGIIVLSIMVIDRIGIDGVIHVRDNSIVKVSSVVEVNTTKGRVELDNISRFKVNGTGMFIKLKPDGYVSGNATIIMSGTVEIYGNHVSYRIPIPCLLSSGEMCYKPALIIPGLDEYIYLPPGDYNTSIILSWDKASGDGRFHIDVTIEGEKSPNGIIVVGAKPENTTGWVTVQGSTKCFSVMLSSQTVKTTKNGLGEVEMWIWSLKLDHSSSSVVKVSVLRDGKTVLSVPLHLSDHSSYYENLLKLVLEKGEYEVVVMLNGHEIRGKITVEPVS